MQIPFWKKWLSHFREIHLESLESDHHDELHVYLSKGRYQLFTKDTLYSYDDLYINFDTAFSQLNIQKKSPENVLLLGLGLGSIPFMLENKYQIKSNYTAVEIDDVMIHLANKYSLSNLQSPIHYICTDASIFVSTCQEKFDLICMDIFFEEDKIPPQFETIEYLEQLRSLLQTNGLLLYNRLAYFQKDINESINFKEGPFKTVFPQQYHIDVQGNWILVGEKK